MQELGVLQKLQIVAFPTILLSLVYASGVALMWKRLAGSPNSSARWGISGFAALLLATFLSVAGGYMRLSIPRISPGGTPAEMPREIALAGYLGLGTFAFALIGSALLVRALWVAGRRAGAV